MSRYHTFIVTAANIETLELTGVAGDLHETVRGCRVWRELILDRPKVGQRWVVTIDSAQLRYLTERCCRTIGGGQQLNNFISKLLRLTERGSL